MTGASLYPSEEGLGWGEGGQAWGLTGLLPV